MLLLKAILSVCLFVCGGKDLWKGQILSMEWKRGVMHGESGNEGDDELV